MDDSSASAAELPPQSSTVPVDTGKESAEDNTESTTTSTDNLAVKAADDLDPTVLPAEIVTVSQMLDAGFDPIGGCSFVDAVLDDARR